VRFARPFAPKRRNLMTKVKNTFKSEYANWLNSYKWTHFVTLTTPYELTLKSSRRLAERFHAKLKEHNFDPILFWVAERYENKDGYHIHALLKLNRQLEHHEYVFITEIYQVVSGTLTLRDLLNAPKDENGRTTYKKWSRIDLQRYSKGKNGTAYVTKYVLKENNRQHAEYDILI
jgi:hypothetical protein